MAHRLTPTERAAGHRLEELIRSLREAFPVVEADRERGEDHVGEMIVALLRMKEGYARWRNPPSNAAEIDRHIERLEGLRANAAFIIVADDPFDEDRTIAFNLVPGEEIHIGYANQRHQNTAGPLALRVAEELRYVAEDV